MASTCKIDHLDIRGQIVPVELHRRKGSRRLSIRFGYRNQLRVSVPWHYPEEVVWDFIEEQLPWIEAQLDRCPAVWPLSLWLEQHPRISAGGRWLAVTLERPGAGERGSYHLDFGSDQVRFVWPIAASEAELSRVFRRCAREVLLGRLRDEANRLQLDLPRLTVRDQASRWGSCSARRSLSVNWRLLLLPPELQDYVLRHELAHLTEMNHSRRFWELLERYDPERARHEKELDRLTPEIMRVGR